MTVIRKSVKPGGRGAGLTALIIIFAVAQTLLLVFLVATLLSSGGNQPGAGFLFAGVVLSVVMLVGLAAIWQWRRWGVYLVGVLAVIGLFSDAFLGVPWVVLLIRVCLLAALGTLIARRWEGFR